jgi:serine/threonine protein kinase
MFEALTGVKPFVGKSAFEVMEKHVRQLPQSFREVNPANDVRSDVEKAIFKALAKDPARRFARAEDLKSRLQALCVLLEERQTVGGGSCVAALAVALVVAVCVLFGWMQVSKFSNTSAATSSSVVR